MADAEQPTPIIKIETVGLEALAKAASGAGAFADAMASVQRDILESFILTRDMQVTLRGTFNDTRRPPEHPNCRTALTAYGEPPVYCEEHQQLAEWCREGSDPASRDLHPSEINTITPREAAIRLRARGEISQDDYEYLCGATAPMPDPSEKQEPVWFPGVIVHRTVDPTSGPSGRLDMSRYFVGVHSPPDPPYHLDAISISDDPPAGVSPLQLARERLASDLCVRCGRVVVNCEHPPL